MNVIVVGGGAAGMMAAYGAAVSGHNVILLERNEKLGKKVFITGKGRCNLTNASGIESFYSQIVNNPKFLYSAFNAWDNNDMIRFVESAGCPVKVERGNRVFPVSDHSSDVIRALESRLRETGVDIRPGCDVRSASVKDGSVTGVRLAGGEYLAADHVILACGGASYPSTGSDGSGYKLAETLGHSIRKPYPALVPLLSPAKWVHEIAGLSLKNVTGRLLRNGRETVSEFGEMLFTHEGISGPIVLSLSSRYTKGDEFVLDLKPALNERTLDERIRRDFREYNNRSFGNSLDRLLPKSLIPVVVERSGIDHDKKVHQVTSEERAGLVKLLKSFDIPVTGTAGFKEAIVTGGGVNVKEINPSDLTSKLVGGLSLAGEMIDVDALTGGYNLQIAWSTGYLAGTGIGW